MYYYTGDLFVNADGIKGSIVAPKAYSGWFKAVQIGWWESTGGAYVEQWQPPDFQNGTCSLACWADAQSENLRYYMDEHLLIKKMEIHYNRSNIGRERAHPVGQSFNYSSRTAQLRMLLEDVYVVEREIFAMADGTEETWTVNARKGTAWALMGPRGPTP